MWCAEAKSQNGDGVMLSELAMAVVPTSESYINPSHLGLAVRNGEVPQLTTIERAGLTLLFLEPYRLTILQDPFTKSFYQHPAESAGHRREMKLGHGRMKRPYEKRDWFENALARHDIAGSKNNGVIQSFILLVY